MDTSAELSELATALAKAQSAIKGAVKDSANPFYKSNYADLDSVWDACREPLTSNGLAIVQSPRADGAVVYVDTLLVHASGQWIRGSLSVRAKDESPQAVGSCITYLRRYALQSFAGVAPEDDDGEAATSREGESEIAQQLRASLKAAPAKPVPVKPKAEPRRTTPPQSPVGLRVQHAKVAKEGTNDRGPWVLYAVKFTDGSEGTTFSKSIFEAAKDCAHSGRLVEAVIVDKKIQELTPIYEAGERGASDEVPF